MFIKGATFSG